MSSLKYEKMDIRDITHGVFAHGCNCQGRMGAGVAKIVRDTWPPAYTWYLKHIEVTLQSGKQRKDLLGCAQIVNVAPHRDDLFVANCFTQEFYGRKIGVRYAKLEAVVDAVDQAMQFAKLISVPFYMTKIGCSLGGLDWDHQVLQYVVRLSDSHEKDITIVEKP